MSWRIAAASAIGTSHIRTGKPCQDSVRVDLLDGPDGPVLICAVSDGAGSAAHAETGSKAAVDASTHCIKRFLEDGGVVSQLRREDAADWLSNVQKSIVALAEERGSTTREFACTLLLAVIAVNAAAFLQVGDGAMVIASGDGDEWSHVFWPQHGEFANSTNFVTGASALDVMEFKVVAEDIGCFASFSDGIENLVLHNATRSVHAPFFSAMIVPVQQLPNPGLDDALSESLCRYLGSEKVSERTDDDTSLVLASRQPSTGERAADVVPS